MNCLVSNCKTYHVISDKIAVTINSSSKLGVIKLRDPRKAQHLQLCNFVHSACRLVIIELMQQYQEMNLAKWQGLAKESYRSNNCRVRVFPGIYGFMVGWLSIWRFEVPFSLQFLCFDSCFPRLWKFFVNFGIATSFERNIHIFPVELTIYYARFSGSFVFFLSITFQRTVILLEEEIFVINIPLARTFTVFT